MRQDHYAAVLAAVQAQSSNGAPGGRTHHIANRLGWVKGTTLARRYLILLVRDGLVRRNERLSYINSIWWEPVT